MLLASLLSIPLVLASSPAPPVDQKQRIFSSPWFFREKPWESPGLTTHPNTAGAGATCNFTKGTRASPAPWSESKMLKIGSQSLVKQRQICKKKCDESNCTTNIMVQWKMGVSPILVFFFHLVGDFPLNHDDGRKRTVCDSQIRTGSYFWVS